MKTQAALLVILLLTGISAVFLPASAEPTLTPHEDPATTKSTIDAYSVLSEYTTIFSLISNQLYENASRLNEQLSRMTLPADLSYIINRYNNLTQQLIHVLNDLQSALDSTSILLDQNKLKEAEQSLDHTSVLVAKAQILLGDLKDATMTVSQRLGVFSSTAQSNTQQAYSQLQSMLEKLSKLIERYHELLDRANQRVEEIKAENLDATSLTLSLNSTSCYVGSTVSVVGTLTAQGKRIGNREVKMLIDGAQAAETITDTNGNYQTVIEIPYKYVDSITIQAIFLPIGSDKDEYLGALSPAITLKLLFFITNLQISAPEVGYPGLLFEITGKVTDADDHSLTDRQVTIALDGIKQTKLKTNQDGTFTAKLTINTQTTLGKHSLTMSVDAQSLYAPTSKQKTITIQKMTTNLQVETPTFIILPTQLEVTGKATSASGPLKGANVQLEYANISTSARTGDDGSFNLTIEVPLNTAVAGSQELRILIQPSEPWQASAETTRNIFALNSAGTSIAVVSSASVFAIAYMRLIKTKKTEKAILESTLTLTNLPSWDKKNSQATLIPSVIETKIGGPRGQILQLYIEALIVVQTFTGTPLTLSMTLSEYAQTVQPEFWASKEFRALTRLAEKSLYSPHEPRSSENKQAKDFLEAIRGKPNAST